VTALSGTRRSGAQRGLVVDDNDMVRDLVCRVLTGAGYAVDGVATAAEALRLDPARYHALVIDVRLGAESGTDLVETLRDRDPLLPARCLLLTGAPEAALPPDVAVLTKPFGADDLVAAVRSLRVMSSSGTGHRSGGPGHRPAGAAYAGPDRGNQSGTEPDPDDDELSAAGAHHLLHQLVVLQERQHLQVTRLLHDGPMQELAAAVLALSCVRKTVDPAVSDALGTIQSQLADTVSSLRKAVPAVRPSNDATVLVEATLEQRVREVLTDVLDVDVHIPGPPPGPVDLRVALAAVQLLLHAAEPTGQTAHALVAIRSDPRGLELMLRAVPSPAPAPTNRTGAAAATAAGFAARAARDRAARLHRMGELVGAVVRADPSGGAWDATLRLPRAD
jgi:DNA-binding response OmpR family regulator